MTASRKAIVLLPYGLVWFILAHLAARREFCMHEVLNEVYLQKKISQMDATLRDESNESN